MTVRSKILVLGALALGISPPAASQTAAAGMKNEAKSAANQDQVLWSGDGAPPLVFGKDVKLKEGSGKYVITGSRPDQSSGLDSKTLRDLAPINVQVGSVKDSVDEKRPVYVELFTPAGRSREAAAELIEHSVQFDKVVGRLSDQTNITIQKCTGQRVCERSCVKDNKEYCCSYKCLADK